MRADYLRKSALCRHCGSIAKTPTSDECQNCSELIDRLDDLDIGIADKIIFAVLALRDAKEIGGKG